MQKLHATQKIQKARRENLKIGMRDGGDEGGRGRAREGTREGGEGMREERGRGCGTRLGGNQGGRGSGREGSRELGDKVGRE